MRGNRVLSDGDDSYGFLRLPPSHWGLDTAEGGLQIGSLAIGNLATRFGTPFYLLIEDRLRLNARRAFASVSNFLPGGDLFYSVKTNPCRRVLEILQREGLGAEVISHREIREVRACSFLPERTIFNGPAKSDEDLALAARLNLLIQVDSPSEARSLVRIASQVPQGGTRRHPHQSWTV